METWYPPNLPRNIMNREIILYIVKWLKMLSWAQKRVLILHVCSFLKSDSNNMEWPFFSPAWHIYFYFCFLLSNEPYLLITFIYLFVCLFVCLWLHWVFIAAHRLSLVAVSGGYSSLQCTGFSLRWLLLLRSKGSRHAGFSSCGLRTLECRLSRCGA